MCGFCQAGGSFSVGCGLCGGWLESDDLKSGTTLGLRFRGKNDIDELSQTGGRIGLAGGSRF